jgi:hypothetical protein
MRCGIERGEGLDAGGLVSLVELDAGWYVNGMYMGCIG